MYDPARISTAGAILFLLWGLLIWGAQFTAVYLGHTLACLRGGGPDASGGIVAIATAVAVVAILPLVVLPGAAANIAKLRREDEGTAQLVDIARWVGLLALVATLWTGAAMFFVRACT